MRRAAPAPRNRATVTSRARSSSTARLCGSAKKPTMSAAMSSPMPWMSMSSRQRLARPGPAPPPSPARQRAKRAVVAREQPRRRLADLRDAERIDEAVERDAAARRRSRRSACCALSSPQPSRSAMTRGIEAEDVAGLADQPVFPERGDVLVAEPFDVEAVARDEMPEPLDRLRRRRSARRCSAAPTSPSSRTARLPQIGQWSGKLIGLAVLRAGARARPRRSAG